MERRRGAGIRDRRRDKGETEVRQMRDTGETEEKERIDETGDR